MLLLIIAKFKFQLANRGREWWRWMDRDGRGYRCRYILMCHRSGSINARYGVPYLFIQDPCKQASGLLHVLPAGNTAGRRMPQSHFDIEVVVIHLNFCFTNAGSKPSKNGLFSSCCRPIISVMVRFVSDVWFEVVCFRLKMSLLR